MQTNVSIVTTLPIINRTVFDVHLVLYLLCFTVIGCVVIVCLFGAIRKQNPLYMFWNWIKLRVRLCCNIKPETIEEESWQLNQLLQDIENTR